LPAVSTRREVATLLKHLRKERNALFTFLRQAGVEATNWRAENAIRPAVVNRKVCGGNRGWYSAETQHILMTMFRTAYQQGVDAVGLMIDLLRSPEPTIAALAMPLTAKPDPAPTSPSGAKSDETPCPGGAAM
jgi:transposase